MGDLIFVVCFRYEQEISKRNDAENEFVMLKKVEYAVMIAVIDVCFLSVYNADKLYVQRLFYPSY